jgi:hypothetical protein
LGSWLQRFRQVPRAVKFIISKFVLGKFRRRSYSAVLGLWNEEVDNGSLEEIPDDEDDVCLPGDFLKRDWPGELIDKTS